MSNLTQKSHLIMFSGQPGTLKTFISSRLAHRLGMLWLPTSAWGVIKNPFDDSINKTRAFRYKKCAMALKTLGNMSARVVLDGGFTHIEEKRDIVTSYSEGIKVIVICTADEETRASRLKNRSWNKFDVDSSSADAVLSDWKQNRLAPPNLAFSDLLAVGFDAILSINTTNFTVDFEGTLPDLLKNQVLSALDLIFKEYRATDKLHNKVNIKRNFASLAPVYEDTTQWRKDPHLLKQLQIELTCKQSKVLDIGAGTGLASQFYKDNGFKCFGIDISPEMSVRAANRLLITNFASALDLPFFDSTFALVIMRQVLHYTEPELAVQEINRVLKTDGMFILSSAVCPSQQAMPIWEEFKNVTQPMRLRVFSTQTLETILRDNGFFIKEIRHSKITRSESFNDLEKRAVEPAVGWRDFIYKMSNIFSAISPEMSFKLTENGYQYIQFWSTLIACKEPKK